MWRHVAPLLGFALLAAPGSAGAHGPCECLQPQLVEVGATVRIVTVEGGYPAYRVIFNPRPTDLGIAPRYLASAFRADAPTRVVLSRSRFDPTRRGRFRVPDVHPGLYLVLIWDGGEGGAHNTWDYLHVTDWDDPQPSGVIGEVARDTPQVTPADASSPHAGTGLGLDVAIAAGIAGLLLGGTLGTVLRRRRRDR